MTEFSSYSDAVLDSHSLRYSAWSFRKFRKKIFCTGNTVILVLFFRFFSILRVSALFRFFTFLICYVELKTAYFSKKKSIPPNVPGVLFGRKVQKKQTNSRKIIVFFIICFDEKRRKIWEFMLFFCWSSTELRLPCVSYSRDSFFHSQLDLFVLKQHFLVAKKL